MINEKKNLSLMNLGRMIHDVLRILKIRSEVQHYEGIRITSEQFSLLHAISFNEDDVIQQDMAVILGKDKSSILRLTDSLEQKRLVRRVASTEDRRKNYLMVTKVGYLVIAKYMKIVEDLMVDLQQGLTQDDIDTFHKVVNQIKSNAEKL